MLANDTDADGDSLTGVVRVGAGERNDCGDGGGWGVVHARPRTGTGRTRFTYEVDDGNGGTAEAAVEVTVLPVNDAPEAADDQTEAEEDGSVEIDVLANDTDIDGDSLRVSSVSAPEPTGQRPISASVRDACTRPAANWHGTDQFTYEIDDGNGGTAVRVRRGDGGAGQRRAGGGRRRRRRRSRTSR